MSNISEHNPGNTVVVLLGNGHNSFYVVVNNYVGRKVICSELMAAVDEVLIRWYDCMRWTQFDHIQILQNVIS